MWSVIGIQLSEAKCSNTWGGFMVEILHKGVGAAFLISREAAPWTRGGEGGVRRVRWRCKELSPPDLLPTGNLSTYPNTWHGWKPYDTDSSNRLQVQCHFLVIHCFFFTPILQASRFPVHTIALSMWVINVLSLSLPQLPCEVLIHFASHHMVDTDILVDMFWGSSSWSLQSMGSQRVRHDWVTDTFTFPKCWVSSEWLFWQ